MFQWVSSETALKEGSPHLFMARYGWESRSSGQPLWTDGVLVNAGGQWELGLRVDVTAITLWGDVGTPLQCLPVGPIGGGLVPAKCGGNADLLFGLLGHHPCREGWNHFISTVWSKRTSSTPGCPGGCWQDSCYCLAGMMECRSRNFNFDTIPVGVGCLITGEGRNPGPLPGLCQQRCIWGGHFFLWYSVGME